MAKYAIWNKKDPMLTPVGDVFTAQQWIEKHPVAGLDHITVVCAGGEINGAFFGTLGQMVDMMEREGCDFSSCVTAQDKLNVIEAFEDERNAEAAREAKKQAEMTAASLASIAAQLEYQSMMTLPDEEV